MRLTAPRTWLRNAGIITLLALLVACQPDRDEPAAPKIVHFDVNLHSYLDRPIFDVMLNGKFIGDTGRPPHRGRGGLVTGVAVPLGEQVITWRLGGPRGTPGNGDTIQAANKPVLTAPEKDETYLGVHIYPDNTVELIPEQFWPDKTEKGEALMRQWELEHGESRQSD